MKLCQTNNKRKSYTNQLLEKSNSSFKDNIRGADLADMQLLSKYNKGFQFFKCVVNIFSKCAWLFFWKTKKGIAVTNIFRNVLNESEHKSNKIWLDKGSKLCNRSMKSWLQDNDMKIYSIHNEGKSVVAEIFIRILILFRMVLFGAARGWERPKRPPP